MPEPVRAAPAQTYARLDPVRLLSKMRMAQQRLVDIADRSGMPSVVGPIRLSTGSCRACGRLGRRVKSAQPRKPSRSKNGAVGDRIPSPSSPKNCRRGLTKSPGGRAANCWSVCRRSVRGAISRSVAAHVAAPLEDLAKGKGARNGVRRDAVRADNRADLDPSHGEHYNEAPVNVGREHSTVRQYASHPDCRAIARRAASSPCKQMRCPAIPMTAHTLASVIPRHGKNHR